ncbi:hypothetical protein [Streptomyces sp. NRRL F-5065]|uniref:hypothetical protein n=1 Tax=Streptomyces sp. NRRL F-5065 TaxID=1463855 RepID=UPI001F355949|nr:hypothetical protein [Streptomyces sp. NRRL F-5065]
MRATLGRSDPRKTQARLPCDGLLQIESLKAEVGLADVVAVQLLLEAAFTVRAAASTAS